MTHSRRLAAPCCALLLAAAACTQGPDYARPQVLSANAAARGSFVRTPQGAAARAPLANWWTALGDPLLDRLIADGLAHAPAIDAALARVAQARSGLSVAQAAQLPAVSASTSYFRTDMPGDVFGANRRRISGELFNAGFDAQWELDLWGGGRRHVEGARAQAEGADAELADARVTLAAEIARAYIQLRMRQVEELSLAGGVDLFGRIVARERERFAQGATSRRPMEQAEAEFAHNNARLVHCRGDITALKDAIAVLTGAEPGTLDSALVGAGEDSAIPLPPAEVAVGNIEAMLRNRPDIRRAERDLAAATARIGEEQASRFPSVTFLGLIGLGGPHAKDMVQSGRVSSIIAPRLSWSFLDFGRGAAAVRGAKAGRDEALAEYHGTVLSALQDAEAALTRYGEQREAWREASAAAAHYDRLFAMEKERFAAGTGTAIAVDRAYVEWANVWVASVRERAALTTAYVGLAKALGVGWAPVE